MLAQLKNSWKSFTIWFNGIIGSLLAGYELFKDDLVQVQQYLTPENWKRLAVAMVVLNIALRFKTSKPLAEK